MSRRRRADQHEPHHRVEGKKHFVSYGGLDFEVEKDTPPTLKVRCTTCDATKPKLSGEALKAFYVEHYNLHVPAPAPPDTLHQVDVEQLCADVREQLAGDELAVVRLVVDGLIAGKPVYGQLDIAADRRNFRREALHESRDLVVYDCAELLRRVRAGAGT